MVRALLVRDPKVQPLADEFRDVDTDLRVMFRTFGNMLVGDDLMRRSHAQIEAFENRENKAAAGRSIE